MSMSQRRLKRQLGLGQVVMLGAIGTIASEIFVLTGLAAERSGPATLLALGLGGILTYSIALNYCEMATSYPSAGGAMTYVREAFGANLLSYLVGSMDCLSSAFYSALSAVGFAYSLGVFLPGIPIQATAMVTVTVFVVLNLFGVTRVGWAQSILGGALLIALTGYVVIGLTSPHGFHWETLMADGRFFVYTSPEQNFVKVMETVALVYAAYVGFEVIADDAEEIADPGRNIPRGILLSVSLVTAIYMIVVAVSLGTVSWRELAGSTTALTDVAERLWPGWGPLVMGAAGMIATLTSINSAMLSGTRETFSLSRFGFWPRSLSHLSRFRTPDVAILFFGAATALMAVAGPVDFLSYISGSGYLFVLFWASLAMIRLRRLHPDLNRPFKAPFFPLTAYIGAATGVLIVVFTPWQALAFEAALLAACAAFYYGYRPLAQVVAAYRHSLEARRNRLLVAAHETRTAEGLLHLAGLLARASEDSSICLLTVVPVSANTPPDVVARLAAQLKTHPPRTLRQLMQSAQSEGLPVFTRLRVAADVTASLLREVDDHVKLVLLGWPATTDPAEFAAGTVRQLINRAPANVAVLLDRGLRYVRRVLVPVGGGRHSRLAVRLAYEIGEHADVQITVLHCFQEAQTAEDLEDQMLQLRDLVEEELGGIPDRLVMRLARARGVAEGIRAEVTAEAEHAPYDLIIIGAAGEWPDRTHLFGAIDDDVAAHVGCSVLLVHRHDPAVIAWLRRAVDQGQMAP